MIVVGETVVAVEAVVKILAAKPEEVEAGAVDDAEAASSGVAASGVT